MTARLGRAVANGSAAPSAKAVRRVSEDLCNDDDVRVKAVRRVSDDRCINDDVPCCDIRRELGGGTVRGFRHLCDSDGVFCCARGLRALTASASDCFSARALASIDISTRRSCDWAEIIVQGR